MTQFWLIERISEAGERYLYLCTADGRETAKQMAAKFLLGDPDDYVVTPLSNPSEVVKMRINIGLVNY